MDLGLVGSFNKRTDGKGQGGMSMERLTEMIGDFVVLKKCAETRCVEICDECGVDKEAKKKLN